MAVDFHGVGAHEPGPSDFDGDAQPAQVFRVFVVANDFLPPLHVLHYLGHIGHAAHLQAELGGLPGLVHLPRGVNEGLAGHAAVVEAVAAHVLSGQVNEQNPQLNAGHK